MSEHELREIEGQLRAWESQRDLSCGVLLTQRGETLLEAGFGHADRANGLPVTPATRFAVASVSKMFTAVAIIDQVASGRLAYDTPVVDVLPEGRRPSTLLPEVTVHHLLCHTSGIADYHEEEPPDGSEELDYADLWIDVPSYSIQQLSDYLALFVDLPPYWPPGDKYWYSNAGYHVLGLVLEAVTGQTFYEVVQERVFDRAGMGDSGFFRLDEVLPDMAVGYVRGPGGEWRTNYFSTPVIGGGDGGSMHTCRDLDRFLTLYDDGTLLGDQRDVALHRHADAGDGFSYGYGAIIYPDGRFGHGGGDPGVEALIARWLDEEANLIVLSNNEEDLTGEVRDLVLEAWRA